MANAAISARCQDGIWVIAIGGELTSQDTQALARAYPWLDDAVRTQAILFDMSRLTYINSAGIALLIRLVRDARRRGFSTDAYGVSSHYQKVFRIVGLTGYMELFPDEYSAFETLLARSQQAGGSP